MKLMSDIVICFTNLLSVCRSRRQLGSHLSSAHVPLWHGILVDGFKEDPASQMCSWEGAAFQMTADALL